MLILEKISEAKNMPNIKLDANSNWKKNTNQYLVSP